jgi:hypothetical protein
MTQARSLCHVIRDTQGLPKVRPGLCEARTAVNTPPELRQQLFQLAREWMQAMMAEEEDEIATPK